MQPASRQQLGKHILAATNTHETIEERRFLCGPCREVKTRTVGAMSQLSSAREAEKRWRYVLVVGYSPDSNVVNTEAEESQLLTTVTKQRLVKTLQVGEDLEYSDL
jgi:hypothetical protein